MKAKLQSIADAAEPGLTTTDLAAAQKAAQSTADAIGAAK
jgi:ribosomal protein L11